MAILVASGNPRQATSVALAPVLTSLPTVVAKALIPAPAADSNPPTPMVEMLSVAVQESGHWEPEQIIRPSSANVVGFAPAYTYGCSELPSSTSSAPWNRSGSGEMNWRTTGS